MWWQYDKRIMWMIREMSNETKYILPRRTHLWECKANEETSLYVQSDESIETGV